MVFDWLSKVARACLTLLVLLYWQERYCLIGEQGSRFFLDQWEAESIVTCSHKFSRAWCRLHVFASDSDWFITLFASVVIAKVIVMFLVLRHSIENRSNSCICAHFLLEKLLRRSFVFWILVDIIIRKTTQLHDWQNFALWYPLMMPQFLWEQCKWKLHNEQLTPI